MMRYDPATTFPAYGFTLPWDVQRRGLAPPAACVTMYVSRAAMSAWQLLCINVKYIVNVKVKAQQTRWTPQSTCLLWASAPAPPRVQESLARGLDLREACHDFSSASLCSRKSSSG